jgi:diguanylate cyclase (GGDEF)-like protein
MQKIAILYDASQAVLSTFQLDEVLDQILTIVRDYFHMEGGSILLLDKQRKVLTSRLAFGKQPANIEVPLGEGLVGNAAKSKRPIYAPDVSKDSRYTNLVSSTRSEVAIPLMVRDEVVGVLDCQSDQLGFFDSETVDLLTLFATQASIALVNAEIYSREQKRALQMEAIGVIARKATAVLKQEELVVQLCSSLNSHLPVQGVSVLTCEDDGTLILRATDGSLQPGIKPSQALMPAGNLAEDALESHETRVLRAGAGGSRSVLYSTAGSELILPLVSAGRALGVLILGAESPTAFPPEDMPTLESVADICATAVQNALYFQQVEQLAYIDGLTGVFNRRLFERRIAEEIERAVRYDNPLSVIMVDIDHFKRVNDEFGHLLGDEVLRSVSHLFGQALRKPDTCCRYGGEEFAIILPETSGAKAMKVAEKLRRLVADYEFPGIPTPITISAGVADFPRCGKTRDDLVRAADDSLYFAKQSGRNCVMSPDNMGLSKLPI